MAAPIQILTTQDNRLLPRQPRSAQILTADSVQQQPIAAPRGSEINHGIHRNTRKRESESTSPFRVLPGGGPRPQGGEPRPRVGSFRGYAFVMIFLAGVISHLRARRDHLLDPFQDRDDVLRDGRGDVVTELVPRVVRVRADHRGYRITPASSTAAGATSAGFARSWKAPSTCSPRACTNRAAARRSGFSTIIRTTVTCRRPMATRSSWPGRRVSRA